MAEKILIDVSGINYALLRKQKLELLSITSNGAHSNLMGIVHLLDDIQDQVVKDGHFTEEEVFGNLSESD